MDSKAVFIDTSFFKALIDSQDDFYDQANSVWRKLRIARVQLITSNYIIDETATLIRARLGVKIALKFRQTVVNSRQIKIVRVLVADEATAWDWFKKNWSRLSYTDCICFAQMQRLNISQVCSFDQHFKRAGFSLVA